MRDAEPTLDVRELAKRLAAVGVSSVDLDDAVRFLSATPTDDPRGSLVFRSALGAMLRIGVFHPGLTEILLSRSEESEHLLVEPQAEHLELLFRELARTSEADRVEGIRRRRAAGLVAPTEDGMIGKLAHLVKSAEWLFASNVERVRQLDTALLQVASELTASNRELSQRETEAVCFACTAYSKMVSQSTNSVLITVLNKRIDRKQELLFLAIRSLTQS